jgi:hypothetical protein
VQLHAQNPDVARAHVRALTGYEEETAGAGG